MTGSLSRRFAGLISSLAILLSITTSIYAQGPNQQVIDLFNSGQDAHQHGKLEDAVKLYSQAIELDPNIYQIHYQLGIALMALKRSDEAVKSFSSEGAGNSEGQDYGILQIDRIKVLSTDHCAAQDPLHRSILLILPIQLSCPFL